MAWQPVVLDSAGHHRLVLKASSAGQHITLSSEAGHQRSDLRWALMREVEIRTEGHRVGLHAHSGAAVVPLYNQPLTIYVGGIEVARRHPEGPNPLDQPLTAYESRYLADNRRAPPARASIPIKRQLVTDLHTHLAGCLRAEDLLRLGAKHGVFYAQEVLAEALIHGDRGEHITDMRHRTWKTLSRALSIPIDRQVTFGELEKIYRLRKPITKSPELFTGAVQK